MTNIKDLNNKIEGLTKEGIDLQESRSKDYEERESLSAQIHQLNSDNKNLTRQVQKCEESFRNKINRSKHFTALVVSKSFENNLLICRLKETEDEDYHHVVQ